jgi:hypothetical protein
VSGLRSSSSWEEEQEQQEEEECLDLWPLGTRWALGHRRTCGEPTCRTTLPRVLARPTPRGAPRWANRRQMVVLVVYRGATAHAPAGMPLRLRKSEALVEED